MLAQELASSRTGGRERSDWLAHRALYSSNQRSQFTNLRSLATQTTSRSDAAFETTLPFSRPLNQWRYPWTKYSLQGELLAATPESTYSESRDGFVLGPLQARQAGRGRGP
jgi:hypothetical protein